MADASGQRRRSEVAHGQRHYFPAPARRRNRRVGPSPQGRELPDGAGQRAPEAGHRRSEAQSRGSGRNGGVGDDGGVPRALQRCAGSGLGLLRAGAGALPLQRVPTARDDRHGHARHTGNDQIGGRARPAGGAQENCQRRARPGARHRDHRQRQEHDACRDDRLHQSHALDAHHHHRGPDRIPASRHAVDRQPARDRHGHALVCTRAAQRAAPGPRRHPGRRNARPGNHRDGAACGRNGSPGLLDAPHP